MSWITLNKKYLKSFPPSRWRRLAIGAWDAPRDPTIYGMMELNVEKALAKIESLRAAAAGEKITITHFVGRVVGEVFHRNRDANVELRWGKFYERASVDVCFQVAIESDQLKDRMIHTDLSSGTVREIHSKRLEQIAHELNHSADRIRKHKDPFFKGIKKISHKIPGFLMNPAVRLINFVLNTLNLWSPALGVPRDGFGSVLVTNVGSLGVEWALPAIFPPAGTPIIVAVGAIYKAPVYDTDADGIVLRTRLERHIRLSAAFDHRYIDGWHASRLARTIRELFDDPSWCG